MLGALLRAIFAALAGLVRLAKPRFLGEAEEVGGSDRPYLDFVKSPNVLITPHFNSDEFDLGAAGSRFRIARVLVDGLEAYRVRLGVPFQVLSGYRTPEHNASLVPPGAVNSFHCLGMAADIATPEGWAAGKFHRDARGHWLNGGRGGVGYYSWGVHLDIGGSRDWGTYEG